MVGNSPTMGGFPTTGWKPNRWLESQPDVVGILTTFSINIF
jgi:hypothetical protein